MDALYSLLILTISYYKYISLQMAKSDRYSLYTTNNF